jgi:hypothetical protein
MIYVIFLIRMMRVVYANHTYYTNQKKSDSNGYYVKCV